ncbi:hypothetical protein KZZ07_08265 [Mameliella sp. CS4]|uniref:hypothetical protein n=1 Tax=Mameliella sp. CS4 TaxID=2862329 RepID=UPI001C5FF7AE|nr:hypothetical protein [Mameliella sp. CS4]MBW4982532.1 hypothetical protein [Mameliella sp. CS4]
MSDELKERLRSALTSYEAAGVEGSHGAREMRGALNRITDLEAQLAEARADGMREAASLVGSMGTEYHPVSNAILAAIEKGEGS